MNKEKKQLLLKDLCTRLPYGVMIEGLEHPEIMTIKHLAIISVMSTEPYKPYLRPMSSMTEEERDELEHLSAEYFGKALDKQIQESLSSSNRNESEILEYIASSAIVDWLNAHHFDHRGLIEKGLALEAPEGMYKTK